MHLVSAHHFGLVSALVAEHHFDAAIGSLDHVVIGEHVAGLVEDEPRTLTLLRHRSIEKIKDQRGGSDVNHRWHYTLVDGDIVLLFGIVSGRGFSLSKLQSRPVAGAAGMEERHTAHAHRKMRGDVPEPAHQQKNQK